MQQGRAAVSMMPVAPAIGAEISGVTLDRTGDAEFAVVQDAPIAHHVIFFHGQQLTNPELAAFARCRPDSAS